MKSILKNIAFVIISIVSSAVIGLLLLIFAYSLDGTRIRNNVIESSSIQSIEGDRYDWAPGILSSALDGFTDSIMLNMAIYTSDQGPVKNAIDNICIWDETLPEAPSDILLQRVLPMSYETTYEWHYGRYWHGYLAYLKPLLYFFSYGEVRYILMMFELVLLIILVLSLYKEFGTKKIIPFIVTLIAVNPISSAISLQYADIYIVTLLGGIILLKCKKIDGWKIFLFIGIVCSYLDLLTYPLLSLGFNLVIFTLINNETRIKAIITNVFCSITWTIGYVGMWIMKWCIWSIYDKDAFKEAVNQILIRTTGDSTVGRYTTDDSIFNAIVANFNVMFSSPVVIMCVIALVMALIIFIVRGCNFNITNKWVQLLIIGLYPLAWCIVIRQHSALHAVFVHRIMAIDILVILMIVFDSLNERGKEING